MKTKSLRYLAALSSLTLLLPLSALARDKNEHSVYFGSPTQIGSTQLTPGTYQVSWQGDGPTVQVMFEKDGKTMANASATLKSNDIGVTQDAITTDTQGANTVLKEIDFGRQKEALILDSAGV